jgi:hypothetical protein
MANDAIKILIIFIITSCSLKSLGQDNSNKPFLFNGCGKYELYNYFSHNLKDWGNKSSFNLFIFKLKGNGEITDLKHFGGMKKTDAEKVIKCIKLSENCWNLPSDHNLFKWIIIPFISGKGKGKLNSDPSFEYSTRTAFAELNNLTSFGIYSGEFYITELIFYLNPLIKLD